MSTRTLMMIAMLALAGGAAPVGAAVPSLDSARDALAGVARSAGLAGEVVISDRDGMTSDAVFGLGDRTAGRPHVAGQRWLWASVTKQVTATLVLQEIERGHIVLDAPVGQYLPDFKGNTAITMRQLIQHRSGLPNPSNTAADADDIQRFYREMGGGIADTARAAGFCAGPVTRPPGGDFEYNNCDYLVLGAVLKTVTGKSFEQLVANQIARPLGLRTLRLAPDRAVRGGASAIGYDGEKPYPALNVRTFGASGALTGSARDLAAFDRALMTGKLLSPATLAMAWSGDPKLGYEALGVWAFPARLKGCVSPVRLVERRGDVGGTQVRNVIAPDLGRVVVVFTNDAALDFGEVWQGKGLTHDLLAAAFCPTSTN